MHFARILVRSAALAAVATATVLLTGCSPAAATAPHEPDAKFKHIHELVADSRDGTLLVATHEGLYRLTLAAGGSATVAGPLGGLDFDPMGFTLADGIAYASGHPGPNTPSTFGSPNLGLITSTDLETWTNVSLTGQTDFHGLTVATGDGAPRVFGYDGAAQRLQRSLDGGATWSAGAKLTARDIVAVDDLLYATTATGLAKSNDDGVTFTVDPAAPALYLVAADSGGTLAGIDTAGVLWARAAGKAWVRGNPVVGTPQAFAVEGSRAYVADDRGISYTDDNGANWTVIHLGS